ncbi:VanZ family protein [Fusobacterium sp.]|uniref:VanZ family protein n=1 Tax=Fusobacterium sp. TaxID=68766 RepID=UPI0025B7DFCB|nr:VanZ family protein [Fusobacterium sp.]
MIFKILTLITICWFCFMTYLSHQDGESTTKLSKGIIEYFKLINYNKIHYIIRKLAHPFVFCIFVVLVLFTLSQKYKNRKIHVFVIMLMVLWTWIDEFTKLSVPGRHFSWYDVSLNLLGVIIGVLIFILFNYLKKEKRKKK